MGPGRAEPRDRAQLRLDQLLVDRGLAATRSRAQALLLAGAVRVGRGDGARRDRRPGDLVDPAVATRPLARAARFVSRGGEKLAGALDAFGIDPAGLVCLDVGASTGGFTDCLLQRGASRVYALDVGRGQLAETLQERPARRQHGTHPCVAPGPGRGRRRRRCPSGEPRRRRRLVHLADARAARHRRPDRRPAATSCPW